VIEPPGRHTDADRDGDTARDSEPDKQKRSLDTDEQAVDREKGDRTGERNGDEKHRRNE
jgi:hypothetical protein